MSLKTMLECAFFSDPPGIDERLRVRREYCRNFPGDLMPSIATWGPPREIGPPQRIPARWASARLRLPRHRAGRRAVALALRRRRKVERSMRKLQCRFPYTRWWCVRWPHLPWKLIRLEWGCAPASRPETGRGIYQERDHSTQEDCGSRFRGSRQSLVFPFQATCTSRDNLQLPPWS
jgi:hypothetical protein